MVVTRPTPDWHKLRGPLAGEVVLPGSSAYKSARKPAIPRFHAATPQAIVLCKAPDDVRETISFARRSGLGVTTRSGGHCFAGRSSTKGVVIDVSSMRSVSVSGDAATVGAGARLGDVYDALDGHGITIPAGCGPSVGISGLTLGGGMGILGRRFGLTSDHLLGADVVLADGSMVECAWQDWAPDAPDELAASLHVFAPDDPDRPPVVSVSGAMLGTESDTRDLLDELVAQVRVDPTSATFEHASYREIKHYLAEHGPGDERPDGHPYNKSEFFREPLPVEAVKTLVENLSEGRIMGQSRELDFTPWAGAYNRVPAGATAFAHREERFLLLHVAVVEPDAPAAERDAARDWLARSWASVHPWGTGRGYPNFPDPDLEDWARAYHGTNFERLARVKARYDPDGFFRFHQSIPSPVPGGSKRA